MFWTGFQNIIHFEKSCLAWSLIIFLGGKKIVNSWAIHGQWLCSLYIKMFGMWTITSFSFSQSLLESIKSEFCWFSSKICGSFPAASVPYSPFSPACSPIRFPGLIIKLPLLLWLLLRSSPSSLTHCIMTTCKVWPYLGQCNISDPLEHAFLKNRAVLWKAFLIQIFYFSINWGIFYFQSIQSGFFLHNLHNISRFRDRKLRAFFFFCRG